MSEQSIPKSFSDSQMRIYFADLCYPDDWDFAKTVPLNVAYIASYLLKVHPGLQVEIFNHPKLLMNRIRETPPDVLGLSHYLWNANLNRAVMEKAREVKSDMAIVMGGPNFDYYTPAWIHRFFQERPELDLYIIRDGEWSFARFIGLLREKGSVAAIPVEEYPDTFYSFDRMKDRVLHNEASAAETIDLGEIPSPYLTGLLDPFLENENLCAIVETNRGCPYSCAFCCWGAKSVSKLSLYPEETVKEEIEYACRRSRNRSGLFYVADGNFGIHERDIRIAQMIQKCSDELGFPKQVYIYFAKNTNQRVMEIAKTIKSVSMMSMSKQTLNERALELAKRKNIPRDQYDELRRECEKAGISTFCELLYGMPGEGYQSFVDGVIATVHSGQKAELIPYRLDLGAENASQDYRKQHGLGTAFRILPRYAASYGDLHAMEYEEIVIQTRNMTREDYLRLRLFHFFIFIFSGPLFEELKKGLACCGLDYATFCTRIIKDEANWTPGFKSVVDGFQQSAREELIPPEKVKHRFIREDIEKVRVHEIALNPLYMSRLVANAGHVADFQRYVLDALERMFGSSLDGEDRQDLLTAARLSLDRIACYEHLEPVKRVAYPYDVEAWLKGEGPLRHFRTEQPVAYENYIEDRTIEEFGKVMQWAENISRAVYIMRMHVFALFGDWVFCRQRRRVG